MKKLVSFIVAVFLLTAMFPVNAFASGSEIIRNDETGMPDKGLYQVILNNLGKKSGTFTKAQAAKIYDLSTENYAKKKPDIKSLKGIENLVNLESLTLLYNNLKNLSGIEKLTKLRSLNVSNNKLSNLSVIKKLTGLEVLYLSYNKLSNLTGIEKLTRLNKLDVSFNNLKT